MSPVPKVKPVPRVDGLVGVRFVVNYFLQGCEAPFWAFIQGSQEAAGETLQAVIVPSVEDILQEVLDPGGHKNKNQRRKGRGRKRRVGLPSLDEAIGGRIRAKVNPYNALNFGAARYLFRGINVVEGVNFAAMILEGVADTAFEGVWGIITNNLDQCPNLSYVHRMDYDGITVVGAAPSPFSLNVNNLVQIQNFRSPRGDVFSTDGRDYVLAASGTCEVRSAGGVRDLRIGIYGESGKVWAESSFGDLDENEVVSFAVSADIPQGALSYLGRSVDAGSVRFDNIDVFGFGV